jgi:hypothetical protein
VCYHLWIVSPLSLTEIRSMLPPGFSADIAAIAEQTVLRARLTAAQTVARLRLGGCACLLQWARDGEGERRLRRRYAGLGLSRDRIIAALERHRRGEVPVGEPAAWRAALAAFVVEHARNAGPTLYYLGFGEEPPAGLAGSAGPAQTMTAAAVRAAADSWLEENRLTEVTR